MTTTIWVTSVCLNCQHPGMSEASETDAACVKNEEKHTRSLIGPQNDILREFQRRLWWSRVRDEVVVLGELALGAPIDAGGIRSRRSPDNQSRPRALPSFFLPHDAQYQKESLTFGTFQHTSNHPASLRLFDQERIIKSHRERIEVQSWQCSLSPLHTRHPE